MGFNFGAFAGGAARGIESGSNLADQMQMRKLRQAQMNAFDASNLGKQAFTNSMIPGMTPMPQGAGATGVMSTLERLPLVGQIGRELGLWGDVPGGAPAGQPAPPTGGMQMAGGMPAPMASPPPGGPAPQPAASMGNPAGQPQNSPSDIMQIVAAAIDRANPGLRQSNPAAFSAAVMLGVEHAQKQQESQLNTDYKRAQIAGIGSENKMRDAQVESIPLDRDIKREQLAGHRADTAIKQEELKLTGPKLKLQEATIKLKELEQEAAQAKMRLEEAELNAKVGDYASQKEWRDAQIARARWERQAELQKQKVAEAKSVAEIDKMRTEGKLNEAKAVELQNKGLSPVAKDKQINEALTKAAVQLRHYDNQKARLLTSMTPNDPKIKALVAETQQYIDAYAARVKDLESQLSTAPKPQTEAAPQKVEIPAPRQQELGKVSSKFLELARKNDMEGAKRLRDLLVSKGVPQHEIDWALQNARTMANTGGASSGPQVPQGY